MKKLAAISLVLALALASCTAPVPQEQGDPEKPIPAVPPEGPFIYHNPSQDYFDRGAANTYGLISETGDVLLPLEYRFITEAYPVNGFSFVPQKPEDRFYCVSKKVSPSEDAFSNQPIALVDYRGRFLTDFSYQYFGLDQQSGKIVGVTQKIPPQYLTIERDGSASPVTDPKLLKELELYSPVSYEEYLKRLQKTGPDIPEQGFEEVIELDSGLYWGFYYPTPEQLRADGRYPALEQDSKSYIRFGDIYDSEGRLVKKTDARAVQPLDNGACIIALNGEDPGQPDRYILADSEGNALDGRAYSFIYPNGDYLIGELEQRHVIYDKKTMAELFSLPFRKDSSFYITQFKDKMALTYTDPDGAIILRDLQSGDELKLPTQNKGTLCPSLGSANRDGDRLMVYYYETDMFKAKEHPEELLEIYDDQGNLIHSFDHSLYFSDNVIVDWKPLKPGDQQGRSFFGLLDKDCNVILPYEYREIRPLTGNAALVIRGDSFGLIDFAGNWIYRQSVYEQLEQ